LYELACSVNLRERAAALDISPALAATCSEA
jgi:hypothetical protein